MRLRVAIVSGMSGAGKSTALGALEDLGFFCVDNLPVPLFDRFIELCRASGEHERVALVVDSREGDFLPGFGEWLGRVRSAGDDARVFFLDANDEVLTRRYSETRRRHPVKGVDLTASIRQERTVLQEIRGHADAVIDTSTLAPQDLRSSIQDASEQTGEKMVVSIVSFGYKHGLPSEADLVVDVRLLRNPYFVEGLRELNGTEKPVRDYVMDTEDAGELLKRTLSLLEYLLPRYQREGKVYLTIGVGCTGGRHRSVAIADELGRVFGADFRTRVRHRDMSRR